MLSLETVKSSRTKKNHKDKSQVLRGKDLLRDRLVIVSDFICICNPFWDVLISPRKKNNNKKHVPNLSDRGLFRDESFASSEKLCAKDIR